MLLSILYQKKLHVKLRVSSFSGTPEIRPYLIPENYSTAILFNLVSFLNLALFAYLATAYYNIIPDSIPRFLFWLILLLIIISAATLRHIICYFIGKASGESVAFNEYILTNYLFYRYLAFILFFISILLCYTTFLPAESLFYTGFITIIFFYFVRLIKLFLIFIKKNISIFYLILYLCAFCLSGF